MKSECASRLWRYVRQASSVLGIVALSVLATLAVQQVLAPTGATTQSTQLPEVRASAFVLVGPAGTVLSRLHPGPGSGNGNLTLYDTTGAQRITITGNGAFNAYDPDGITHRFRAGFAEPGAGFSQRTNGVWLDPNGTISILPTSR